MLKPQWLCGGDLNHTKAKFGNTNLDDNIYIISIYLRETAPEEQVTTTRTQTDWVVTNK